MNNCYLEKITQVYAFVSIDEEGEGVIGMTMPINGRDTMIPFITADKERMEQLKLFAIKIAQESGRKIKLIKFTNRKDIETL